MHRHVARLAVESAYLDPVWNAAGAEKLHLGRRTDCIVVARHLCCCRDGRAGVNGQDGVEIRTKGIDRDCAIPYGREVVPDSPVDGEAAAVQALSRLGGCDDRALGVCVRKRWDRYRAGEVVIRRRRSPDEAEGQVSRYLVDLTDLY